MLIRPCKFAGTDKKTQLMLQTKKIPELKITYKENRIGVIGWIYCIESLGGLYRVHDFEYKATHVYTCQSTRHNI
jgi:hypothetical protein